MKLDDFEAPPTPPTIYGPVRQIAYIVPNIDDAIAFWQSQNVGPFLVTRQVSPFSNSYYRGTKTDGITIDIAFSYVGEMQLELIAPVNDVPSPYQEMIQRHDQNVHHYAVWVKNFPEAYRYATSQPDNTIVMDTGIDGIARMSYIENSTAKITLEVIEWNAMTAVYFQNIEKRLRAIAQRETVEEFHLSELTPKVVLLPVLAKFAINKLLGRLKR